MVDRYQLSVNIPALTVGTIKLFITHLKTSVNFSHKYIPKVVYYFNPDLKIPNGFCLQKGDNGNLANAERT